MTCARCYSRFSWGTWALRHGGCLLLVVAVTCPSVADELDRASSWESPDPEWLQAANEEWWNTLDIDDETADTLSEIWRDTVNYVTADSAGQAERALSAGGATGDGSEALMANQIFDAVIDTIAVALPEAKQIITQARTGEIQSAAELDALQMDTLPPVIKDNLRLLVGKCLALNQLYDEAKVMLQQAQLKNVADPAALLFYQSVAHYRLREKEPGIATLDRLLEREIEIPNRYSTLAKLMRIDLESLEPDSLDEIARIMDSIQVRLGHGHAGTRTRQEEQDVIDKLEKMIEELEQQLQKMQMAQAGQGNSLQSGSPAQDSSLPGGQGQGDVDSKDLGEKTDWGNLPPKQREETIQQLGKEFPSHYRDVIEEYFRKLARDEAIDD